MSKNQTMFYYPLIDNIKLEISDIHHAEALFQIVDEHRDLFSQWFDWVRITKTADDVVDHIRGEREKWGQNKGLDCTIIADSQPIGRIGFHEFNRANNSACLGYWLSPKYEGRGIMTLAAKALIGYVFEKENINKVILRCAIENDKSKRVAKRLGMTVEGVLLSEEIVNDTYIDLIQFCLLKKDYHINNNSDH